MFSRAWKRLGEDVAADRTRASISYLLRGPDAVPLEDRLTQLIEDQADTGMPGFKEALLTKVLCIVEPERFLPILTYATEETGKRDLTRAVYGLHLPRVDLTSMQVGRLAIWSNDLLLELAGDGFSGPQHVAEFIWWAKDRVEHTALGVGALTDASPRDARLPDLSWPTGPQAVGWGGSASDAQNSVARARSMYQYPCWMSSTNHG